MILGTWDGLYKKGKMGSNNYCPFFKGYQSAPKKNPNTQQHTKNNQFEKACQLQNNLNTTQKPNYFTATSILELSSQYRMISQALISYLSALILGLFCSTRTQVANFNTQTQATSDRKLIHTTRRIDT